MTAPFRVVIHLDEREKAPLALNNAKNLIAGLEGVEVEVVAHAAGVEALRTGSPHAALMRELADRGVRFVVCEKTLRSRSIPRGDLLDHVRTVPSGVVELVVRQAEGWCYLRP
jgi:intracellular sulfur oxidation DsrE/DsrF family protein